MLRLRFPPPGTVVYVRVCGLWKHKGVVSDRWHAGKPMILCNSPRFGVVEQPWDDFFQGEPPREEGYPGSLPYPEVLRRARSRLGEPYLLLQFNCDHLKNYAHGLPVESEQLRATLASLTFIGVVCGALARA